VTYICDFKLVTTKKYDVFSPLAYHSATQHLSVARNERRQNAQPVAYYQVLNSIFFVWLPILLKVVFLPGPGQSTSSRLIPAVAPGGTRCSFFEPTAIKVVFVGDDGVGKRSVPVQSRHSKFA
jgi:hypothetical protein